MAFSKDPPPDAVLHPVVSSEAAIAWAATLHPFADELPTGADWVDFARPVDPSGEIGELAKRWTAEDSRNDALKRAVPISFVRDEIIKSANHDLAFTAAAGYAVTIDPLHMQVAAQRFNDEHNWKFQGFAVPILFPQVGDLPWETIGDLRRDKNMARFRAELREVEDEATAEAIGGDIEAAAEHAYRRHLAAYPETLPSVGEIAHRTLTGFIIGGVAGFAVSGITEPLGTVAGAALGAVPTTVMDVRQVIRGRRSRGWVALEHRIEELRGR